MQDLLAEPRHELTEAIVLDALSLIGSPRLRWGVEVLDAVDAPTGEAVPVESGKVTWSYRPPEGGRKSTGAAAEVRRRCDLLVVGDPGFDVVARRYRPWIELQASTGEWVPWYLGVFLPSNPGVEDDGVVVRRPLKLADKTYRWSTRKIENPVTVPVGANVVDWVQDRLALIFGETLFSITPSTTTLAETKVFTTGMSELELMNALLETAGYDSLTADEMGRPRSVPLADLAGRGPEWTYGPAAGRVLPGGSVEPLLPTLPNVVRFVARQGPSLPEEGNGVVTVRNQSTGPGSIDARGEEVFHEVDVEAEGQDELEAIAAAEANRYFAGGGLGVKLRVGINPAHSDRDVIALDKPRLDLSGEWLVTSWTMPLHAVTNESAVTMDLTAEARTVVS